MTVLIVVSAVVLTSVGYDVLVSVGPRSAAVGRAPTILAAPPPPSATADASAPSQRPVLGISVPTAADLDHFIRVTGTQPEVVNTFEAWSSDRPLDRTTADAISARHARLMVTWEPWAAAGANPHQPEYDLASIIDGEHDAYIDMYAASAKRFGRPMIIRLMHEMNGGWYPWGNEVDGNRSGQFILAWRHVHDRFAALGVTNVQWMWAPNSLYGGSAPLEPLFPGDGYVDMVGVSNYNWGDQVHDGWATRWRTFDDLFAPTIAVLRTMSARPVWIAEVGSSDDGGSKAAWITAALDELRGRSDVAGLIWFDHVDERHGVDWRIETETDAATAWRQEFLSRPASPVSDTR